MGGPRTGSDNKQQVVNNPADAARRTADTQSTAVSAAASKLRPAQADTPAADVADQNTAPQPAATTVNTVAVQQSDAVVVQSPPVTATAQVSSPVSRAVTDTLAWAGLDPSLTDSPVAPVESPALLAVLAGWRRQSQQALTGEQPTNLADVPQTSQTVDPMVTADQAAADTTAPVTLAAADTTAPMVNLTAAASGATVPAQALPGDKAINPADPPQTSQTVDPMVTATQAVADASTMQLSAPVTLAAAAADTTPPTVNLTAPANGATVSGNVTISANAADNVGVTGVQFLVDGGPLGAEVTSAPYSLSVDASGAANGPYTLTAVARDTSGNTTTSAPVVVTLANGVGDTTAPTVNLTAPANGATVSGNVTLSANAADNVGVAGVQFLVDGGPLGAEDTSAPYSLSVDASGAANGPYTLTAVARDTSGNTTTSAPVVVTLANGVGDTTAPTVNLTAPANGATVSGTVTISANAADNVGVAGVQFLVDGGPLGAEVTSAPYSLSVDASGAANGPYTLTAVARDTSGNTTTSAPVTVNVLNGPVSFTNTTVVSGLTSPTDFRFLPDGRTLIAQKGGTIQVASATGQLQSTPLITLPTDSTQGRGLWGIAVDPNYQTNGYVYAAYTLPDDAAGHTYEELARITVTDPTASVLTADPTSEQVLVLGDQPGTADHFGGGLAFGPDGTLYWSTGDNVCCTVIDGSNSQNLSNIYGKVLRLDPDHMVPDLASNPLVPADNPFANVSGDNPFIYAYGFRNPFRLTFTPDGKLLVADVGQATWEEVDLVTAGANYGWPNAEGPCLGIGVTSCATPPPSPPYTNPIYAYLHAPTGGDSITGVMVYNGPGSAPAPQHTVLITDFNQGWVQQLTCASDYSSCGNPTMFVGAAPGNTVKLAQGPDGNIYQLLFGAGQLVRITPSGTTV